MTRALVLDVCATQLIEQECDALEAQIRSWATESGLMATGRYSLGYGDLDLSVQPQVLAVLDAPRKIALTCTESLILLPRKSVTAMIGAGNDLPECSVGCESCTLRKTCTFCNDRK